MLIITYVLLGNCSYHLFPEHFPLLKLKPYAHQTKLHVFCFFFETNPLCRPIPDSYLLVSALIDFLDLSHVGQITFYLSSVVSFLDLTRYLLAVLETNSHYIA